MDAPKHGNQSWSRGVRHVAAAGVILWVTILSAAADDAWSGFVCAGSAPALDRSSGVGAAAKAAATPRAEGTRSAIAIFATFAGGGPARDAPSWARDLFDPDLPGSFSHFYETMSFGQLRVRGQVAERWYISPQESSYYLSDGPTEPGDYGAFCLEVLRDADADIDFARFDNDGPDGVPSSGDDDGVVDAVFLIVDRAPFGFLRGPATGMASLGLRGPFITDDRGPGGAIVVAPGQGMIQQGRSLSETVGAMCHEFGHVLGLPDLYDVDYLRRPSASPWEDSAGIGAWGLMGWGALGWGGNDGPNSFSAWSRQRLGWAEVSEPAGEEETFQLEDVGQSGQVYRIPLNSRGHFLLEYRRRTSSYYDRAIPGEGLLVWHIERDAETQVRTVDLECADGRWEDAGYPLGSRPAPHEGGDNLDFWAHDSAYARRHGGNLGDAFDPFDGHSFTEFTPDTNPAATSLDGEQAIHLHEITIADGRVSGRVRLAPLAVALRNLSPRSEQLLAGEAEAILFEVENTGFRVAEGLRAVLRSDDSVLEIVESEMTLRPLDAGERISGGNTGGRWGFPHVRFPVGMRDRRTATVELSIYRDDQLLARDSCTVTGVPAHVVTGQVLDPEGEPLHNMAVNLFGEDRYAPAISDSTGLVSFYVHPGIYTFTIRPADGPWGSLGMEGIKVAGDTSLVFRLPPIHLVSGVIRHGDGTPASGWRVNVYRDGRHVGGQTSTDGAYSVRLSAGAYVLATLGHVDGRSESQVWGELTLTDDAELDIHLDSGLELLQGGAQVTQGVDLTMHIVDEGGIGIDDIGFSVGPAYGNTYPEVNGRTGADGRGRAHVLAGSHRINLTGVPTSYLGPENLRVSTWTDTTVTVVLDNSTRLRGRLVDESGQGVSAELELMGEGWYYSTRSQRVSGEYGPIHVVAGSYRCVANPVGRSTLPNQYLGTVQVHGDTTVDFTIRRGVSVSGQIHGIVSETISDGRVWARDLGGRADNRASLDSHGAFVMMLAPGVYSVEFASTFAGSQTLGTIQVSSDTMLAWQLLGYEDVKGQVVDVGGSGVAGIHLTAVGTAGGRRIRSGVTTGPDGEYSMRLPTGTYTCRAYAGNARQTLSEFRVPSPRPIVHTLPGGATLEIRPTGFWLSLSPSVFDLAQHLRGATSAETFVSHGRGVEVNPGLYRVVASLPGSAVYNTGPPDRLPAYERVVDDLLIEGATKLRISMPFQGGRFSVKGTVTHLDSIGPALSQPIQYAAYSLISFYDAVQKLLIHAEIVDGRFSVDVPGGRYEVAVRVTTSAGAAVRHIGSITVDGDRTWDVDLARPTVVEPTVPVPQRFALQQNYPNPFNGDTVIRYASDHETVVTLTVYSLLGQRVRRLVDGRESPGQHTVQWDGRDDSGRPVASGVYLYRLQVEMLAQVRKLLLLR